MGEEAGTGSDGNWLENMNRGPPQDDDEGGYKQVEEEEEDEEEEGGKGGDFSDVRRVRLIFGCIVTTAKKMCVHPKKPGTTVEQRVLEDIVVEKGGERDDAELVLQES